MVRVLVVLCAALALAVATRPLKSVNPIEKALQLEKVKEVLVERVFDEKRLQKVTDAAEKMFEISEYQNAMFEEMKKIVAAEKVILDNAKLDTATDTQKEIGYLVEHIQLLGQRMQSFQMMFNWLIQQIQTQNTYTPRTFYPRSYYPRTSYPGYWASYRHMADVDY